MRGARSTPLILGVLLFPLASPAQHLRFQHLTTDDGLSDNVINCLIKDRTGFLWIGTEKGLDRFDGQRVDKVPGTAFAIASVAEDDEGILWAATKDNGLIRVDPATWETDHFRHTGNEQGSIATDLLTSVHDLNDTTLLIGSREYALIFMDKRTQRFSYWNGAPMLDPAQATDAANAKLGWCHAIAPLNDETLWIGLLNSYLTYLVHTKEHCRMTAVAVHRQGSETQTCAAIVDGDLYSGGWQNGIDVIDLDQLPDTAPTWLPAPHVLPTTDEVLSMVCLNNTTLICGTRAQGILWFATRRQAPISLRHKRTDSSSIASDRIRCLLVDSAGVLWAGTAKGLSWHDPNTWPMRSDRLFDTMQDETPDLTFHMLQSEGQRTIRAYTSNGFYVQDGPGAPIEHHPVLWRGKELQPTTSALDHDGRTLIGTEYGILRSSVIDGSDMQGVDIGSGSAHVFSPGDMYQTRFIAADSLNGRPILVVGVVGYGIEIIDPTTNQVIGNAMHPGGRNVRARSLITDMVRDSHSAYWTSSADGITRWDKSRPLLNGLHVAQAVHTPEGHFAPGVPVQLLEIVGDTLWAVARAGDLLCIANGSLQHIVPPWPVGSMWGLIADGRGRLWITADESLVRYDIGSREFIKVPVNDGREFRKLSRAIALLGDGTIAFAADNALIRFDPGAFDHLPSIPTPYLVSAKSGATEPRITNGMVQLGYRASVLDIHISALAFGFPQPLSFEYRLEGVESEWRACGARDLIRYAGVPVGTNRLLVRVRDPFGRTGPVHQLLVVEVAGPAWQQWWFYACALVLLSIGLYALYRYRLAQALKLQAVRDRIASDLHDEVGSSLSSITIGSQLAAQFSEQDNEQVRSILVRIGETSSESLRSMSDIVWAIDPKNDEGEALVKRMRRIANELLESKGIDVSFSVTGGVEDLRLPMNARKEIVLIYKEAIHNASKYSGASTVQVSVHKRSGILAVSVKDDGRGFDPRLHPDGHGLGSMHRRAGILGATLTVMSSPGQGTLVGAEVDLTRIRD